MLLSDKQNRRVNLKHETKVNGSFIHVYEWIIPISIKLIMIKNFFKMFGSLISFIH